MRITLNVEEKILNLHAEKYTIKEIAKKIKCSDRSVCNVLKKYRVPKQELVVADKNKNLLQNIISLHLLKNCDDIYLLSKMFFEHVYNQKIKKIFIPERVQKTVDEKKIKKIFFITKQAGLDFDVVMQNDKLMVV